MSTNLIEQGKVAYKNREYTEAARLFGLAKASTARPQDVLSACDLQIGAIVKTKHFEPAIDIAKSMIRTNRRDARGYIRAAQIERLADRPLAATRWYQHGLKHISPSDPLYPALQGGIKKCEAQLVASTTKSRPCDPFTVLPVEVARLVLSHLDYRQTTAILRVSRGWRSFLSKEAPLTNSVDFSKARTKVTIKALGACLRRLTQYPSMARLVNLTDPAVENLQQRLPAWLRQNVLQELVAHDAKLRLSYDTLPQQSSMGWLELPVPLGKWSEVLAACPRLQRLHIPHTLPESLMNGTETPLKHDTLEILRISHEMPGPLSVPDLHLPRLHTLHLKGLGIPRKFSDWSSLQVLHLNGCAVPRDVELPPSLTGLVLKDVVFSRRCPYTRETPLFLPNLLNLHAPLDTWDLSIDSLRIDRTAIQTIDLQDQYVVDHQASWFSDMPSLRRLVLRNGRLLSGIFVKDLLEQSSGNIEFISLVDCEKVSTSTVAWAQSQHGVKVELQNRSEHTDARGGRRLRT